MAKTQQFCTFYLDGHFFGVEVEKVQEVLRYQEMTRIPRAPNTITGLINLRGQIVTALDLRRRLELRDRDRQALPMNVVIQTEDGGLSLLVDEIGDILEVSQESFEEAPDTLQGLPRELIKGVHKLEDRLLLILDTEKAMDSRKSNTKTTA